MRTLPVFRLAVAFIPILAGPAVAQYDPRLSRPIIEKAVKVLGGEAVLGRCGATHTRLKATFFKDAPVFSLDFKGSGEMWTQPGSARVVTLIDIAGQETSFTLCLHDGKGWLKGERKGERGAVHDMQGDMPEEAKQLAYVNDVMTLLPLLKDKQFTLKGLGKEEVHGAELVGVGVTSAGHPDLTIWFDPEAGYPKRVEYKVKSVALNKEVERAIDYDDYRVIDPAATEERTLKDAKVGADAAALLDFLRGQVHAESDRKKVPGLIEKLGDDDPEVREKAMKDLVALGSAAVPELRRATNYTGAQVPWRARRCLEQIAGVSVPGGVLAAALRMVALKRPAGAAEVLLALAPSVTDEADVRELRGALAAVAVRDGKKDPAVVKALEDTDPARRAAAAAALGKDGGAFEKEPGRRVFAPGLKRPMKTTYHLDGEVEYIIFEVLEVQIFNRFKDEVFAKPE
jgi:HEAT repeat protein